MNEQESLRIIAGMIDAARNRVRQGEGNISMVWGWVVLTASLSQFILHKIGYHEIAPYAWMLVFVGVGYSIFYSIKLRKRDRSISPIDRILDSLWVGFTVCMISVGFLGARLGNDSFVVIELLYGLSLFVSGSAFRFTPLIVGGVWCWLCAWVSVFVAYPYHLLVLAVSVLGYIIPGFLLNRKANVQRS